MAGQLAERGAMPQLQALLATGACGRLRAEPEQVPAIVWTTIATARGPESHGVSSASARRLAGMRTPVPVAADRGALLSALVAAADLLRITRSQPATAVLRGAKTFWNVASEKGLKVGIVNWWVTWPAEAVNGYIVSDRAFFKLEKGGAADREVHPPEAFARLTGLLPAPGADRARRLDAFQVAAACALRREARPDIEAVYLPGLDIVTLQQVGDASPADLASLETRLEAVRAHYRFVDGLIARFREGLGPTDVVALVGDPGRLARRAPDPPDGLLVLAGGPITHRDLGRVSERDVAGTVLHLVGLPASLELEGSVLEMALSPEFRKQHPVRVVESYGRRPAARPAQSAFDPQMLEELRSLGYIQ
jgi:hypothetical protein